MSVEEQDSLEPAITAVGHYIFLLLRSLSWRSTKFHPKGEKCCYIEDTRQQRQNMNFTFERYKRYLTLKTKYCFPHKKIKFVFSSHRVILFLFVYIDKLISCTNDSENDVK